MATKTLAQVKRETDERRVLAVAKLLSPSLRITLADAARAAREMRDTGNDPADVLGVIAPHASRAYLREMGDAVLQLL